MFLKKYFIFKEIHGKDSDKYRFPIKSICLHMGGKTVDLSSTPARLPARHPNISWDGNLRSVLVFLPHISKIGLLVMIQCYI